MSELTPELAADVVAACQAGAEEAAGALNRGLDGEFQLAVGEPATYSNDALIDGFEGPGLAVLMLFGEVGVTALIPETSGLLPDWYADPDPTGESKLTTLAQELSMLLVPETLMADDFQAARVTNLSEALSAAEVADGAGYVPLTIEAGDKTAQMSLIWPLAAPKNLLSTAENEAASATDNEEPATPEFTPRQEQRQANVADYSQLPGYARSLLSIEIPVRVVLASKKEQLTNIVELAAGSIIKFEKSCEEMLELYVGEQEVAEGEAVKVGDKFGFRVGNMVMPDEHFMKVVPKKTG